MAEETRFTITLDTTGEARAAIADDPSIMADAMEIIDAEHLDSADGAQRARDALARAFDGRFAWRVEANSMHPVPGDLLIVIGHAIEDAVYGPLLMTERDDAAYEVVAAVNRRAAELINAAPVNEDRYHVVRKSGALVRNPGWFLSDDGALIERYPNYTSAAVAAHIANANATITQAQAA